MAKKMYYTEAEAAGALGVSADELANLVRDDKLRVFQDGSNKMFKVADVDALKGGASPDQEVELSPADTTADEVSLSEADATEPATKEDTVITAEGISIFDDEDLEIEAADPMAKTQIAPSLEEQMSMEGVGSGSGLLDLTRESDDTSLGAEVLDHIEMDDTGGSDMVVMPDETGTYAQQPGAAAEAVTAAAPVYVEAIDASSGFFGGMIVGCALVAVILGAVVLAAMQGVVPGYLSAMKEQVAIVVGASVVVVLVFAIAGLMVGKSTAARRSAIQRMGG